MSPDLAAVRPVRDAGELTRLITTNRTGGVPVIEDAGELAGIVSESDLFLKEKGVPFSLLGLPGLFARRVMPEQPERFYSNASRFTAADLNRALARE